MMLTDAALLKDHSGNRDAAVAGAIAIGSAVTYKVATEATALPETIRYGFRVDPMKWIGSNTSWRGAWVRTTVSQTPKQGDQELTV